MPPPRISFRLKAGNLFKIAPRKGWPDLLIYIDFHNYAYTWKRLSLEELKTLDIRFKLFDNAAFVRIHLMEKFSKDFLGVLGMRGRGSQLWLI